MLRIVVWSVSILVRHHTKSSVHCDALLLDENTRTDTYPTIRVEENQTEINHEATVLKVDDDQLFYVISRGLDESEAYSLIVNEFIEPIAKDLRCQAVWAK